MDRTKESKDTSYGLTHVQTETTTTVYTFDEFWKNVTKDRPLGATRERQTRDKEQCMLLLTNLLHEWRGDIWPGAMKIVGINNGYGGFKRVDVHGYGDDVEPVPAAEVRELLEPLLQLVGISK